jgi:hypothetical protein
MNEEGKIWYAVGADTSGLQGDIDKAKQSFKTLSDSTQAEGNKINSSFSDVGKTIASSGDAALAATKALIDKAKENIQNLEKMIAGLKKQMDDANPGTQRENLNMDFNSANHSLNAQKTILADLEKQKGSLVTAQKAGVAQNEVEESSQVSMIGSLGRWATGLFTVTAALKVGKSIMESTESTAHQLEIAVGQVESATNFLFKTIATGDWSNFINGMEKAIVGAREYVDAMEEVNNKTNEQKIRSSNLDIKIGEQRALSYSSDPKVVKAALTEIIKLQTQKLTEEAQLAKQSYEVSRKKIADDNGWNEKELENTIKYYSKNKDIIQQGEEYNKLVKGVTLGNAVNSPVGKIILPTIVSSVINIANTNNQEKQLDDLIKRVGPKIKQYGQLATDFSKVTFKERNELANQLAVAQDKEAAININNRRDKQRLVTLNDADEKAAVEAAKKAADEKNKVLKEQLDYTTEIGKKRIANTYEIEQQNLNAEAEGAEKSRKQADLDYRKTLSNLDIQKAERIKKQNEISGGIDKKTGKPTEKFSTSIPIEDQKQLDDLAASALKVKNAEIEKITKTELDKLKALYVKYGDERVKIEDEYNDRIQKLAQAGFIIQAAEVAMERNEKISAVSERLIKETDLYKLASGKQLLISKELTQQLIEESKKQIAAAVANPDVSKRLSQADADNLLAKLDKADLTVQKTDNPFADLIAGVEIYKKARLEQSKSNTKTDIANFSTLEDAANKAQKATLQAAAEALHGISDIISTVTSELTGLTDAQKKTVDEVTKMIAGAASLAEGIATGNPITIIQGSIELLMNLQKLMDVSEQQIEKRIADDKTAIDNLKDAYDKLGYAIQKAFSTDKAKLIAEQTANLKDQAKAIQDQIDAENKKQTLKDYMANLNPVAWAYSLLMTGSDPETLKTLNQELADINQQIETNKDAQLEALTGTSVMSAIDDFANAYADAFTTGEDAALKSADIVKNILKKALVEDLKDDLQKPIQTLMDLIAGNATQAAIDAQMGVINAAAATNLDAFKNLGLTNPRTAASTGIATASQASVDENNGRLTAIEGHTFNMNETLKIVAANGVVMRAHLSRISNNTDRLEAIENSIGSVKSGIDQINTKGINIKV